MEFKMNSSVFYCFAMIKFQVSAGRELSDVYLKHPGNESSEDEEGQEEEAPTFNEDFVEEQNFQQFVQQHRDHIASKK